MDRRWRVAAVAVLLVGVAVTLQVKTRNTESSQGCLCLGSQVGFTESQPPLANGAPTSPDSEAKLGTESPSPPKSSPAPAPKVEVTPRPTPSGTPVKTAAATEPRPKAPPAPPPAEPKPKAEPKPEAAAPEPAKPASLPRMLELGSETCTPCKMMQSVLAELREQYAGKLQVDFIDVWKDSAEGDKYGVRVIPTQILFDAAGKEIFRHTGFYPKDDIVAKFKELGIELT